MCVGCAVALLATFAIGAASAAVVPFSGIEYSWLHHDDDQQPVAEWIKRINDLTPVRNGDMMQFQNRWYNSYSGTADIRISYGGEHAGICAGADEYVSYGLNYGNYYPSSTESMPYYSKVLACNKTPLTLLVSHQYVYNGIQYGTINPDNDYTMLFQWRVGPDAEATISPSATGTPSATTTPSVTVNPNTSATPTLVPLPSTPASSPGFDAGTALFALAAVLAVAGYCVMRKR